MLLAPRSPSHSPPASPCAPVPVSLPEPLGWSQDDVAASQASTQIYEWKEEQGNYPYSQASQGEVEEEEDPFLAARRENGTRAEEYEAEVTSTQSQAQVGGGCDPEQLADNAENKWEDPVKSGLFVPGIVLGTTIVAPDYKGWGAALVAVALEHSRNQLSQTAPTLLAFAEDPQSFCAQVCAELKHACGPPDSVMENLLWRLVAGDKMDAFNLSPRVSRLMSEVGTLVSELRTSRAVVELLGTSEFHALDLADLVFEKVRRWLQREGPLALVDFFNTPCAPPQHLSSTFTRVLEATAETTGCGFTFVCWEACLVVGCKKGVHYPQTRSLKRQRSTSE